MISRSLLALFLCVAAAAHAATPPVALADLTWTELRDRVAAGATIAIVPVGGTEQNGPHMTLGKHNARVAALAERIAAALGNALVAPVIAYVPEGGTSPPTSRAGPWYNQEPAMLLPAKRSTTQSPTLSSKMISGRLVRNIGSPPVIVIIMGSIALTTGP